MPTKKRVVDLHSRIAYGDQKRPRTRVVAGLYQEYTTANYGRNRKPREHKVVPFEARVLPFKPEPAPLLEAFVVND